MSNQVKQRTCVAGQWAISEFGNRVLSVIWYPSRRILQSSQSKTASHHWRAGEQKEQTKSTPNRTGAELGCSRLMNGNLQWFNADLVSIQAWSLTQKLDSALSSIALVSLVIVASRPILCFAMVFELNSIILYLAVPTLGTMLDIIDISRASFIIYLIC